MPYFRITVWAKQKKYCGVRYFTNESLAKATEHFRLVAEAKFIHILDIEVALLDKESTSVKILMYGKTWAYENGFGFYFDKAYK